jgi:hypothetical protein
MSRARRLIVLLPCFASLAACTYKLYVGVSDTLTLQPLFRLSVDRNSPVSAQAIKTLVVAAKSGDSWNYKSPAWCFEVPTGSYREVAEVRYGVVPVGFSECAAPSELKRGTHYQVLVSGAGSAASTEFNVGE